MKTLKFFPVFAVCLLLTTGCSHRHSEMVPAYNADSGLSETTAETSASENAVAYPFDVKEYMAVAESYLEGTFRDMGPEETRELSELLQGHYHVTGRTDGGDNAYYIVVRKSEAPAYDNLHSLDVGEIYSAGSEDTILRIGYYDENADSTPLYELKDYNLLDVPCREKPLLCFCFSKRPPELLSDRDIFQMAFSGQGRKRLDFMKEHPQLAWRDDGQSGIEFYYLDEETLDYASEPALYFIPFAEEEQQELESLALKAEMRKTSSTSGTVEDYLKNRKLYSTGVYMYLPGHVYQLFGNHEAPGTLLRFPGTESHVSKKEDVSIFHSEELWQTAMDRLWDVMGADYGDFDSGWFDKPLKSASLQFPELVQGEDEHLDWEKRCQTVSEQEKLAKLGQLMGKTLADGEAYGFSGCPYTAELLITREDGQTRRIYLASDSCDSMAWEGRIAFEYGSQRDMAEIFDEAMESRLD